MGSRVTAPGQSRAADTVIGGSFHQQCSDRRAADVTTQHHLSNVDQLALDTFQLLRARVARLPAHAEPR